MNILELSEEEKKLIRKQHEDAMKKIFEDKKEKEEGLRAPQNRSKKSTKN